MFRLNFKRRASHSGIWLGTAICVVVALAARHLATNLNYHELVRAMRHTPVLFIAAALAMTLISYAALIGTDWLAARYARAHPRVPILLLASFCGYGLGNVAGFGALSGAAVRLRIYTLSGLTPG